MNLAKGLVELSPIRDEFYPCFAIRMSSLTAKYAEHIKQEDGRGSISPYHLYRILRVDRSLIIKANSKEELTQTNWATLTTLDLKTLFVLHIGNIPLEPNYLVKDIGKIITILKLKNIHIKIR